MRSESLHGRRLDDGARRRRWWHRGYVSSNILTLRLVKCAQYHITELGWGQFLGQYLNIPVVNDAIAGTSARSYTEAGNFTDIIDTVQSGDFVIIEFGHNDGTSGGVDNGREDATSDGYNATTTVVEAE